MCKRAQDGHFNVHIRESKELLDAACTTLRIKKPEVWRAFELREIKGMSRKMVAQAMGTTRLADVNENVDAAKKFLVSVLPPRPELI